METARDTCPVVYPMPYYSHGKGKQTRKETPTDRPTDAPRHLASLTERTLKMAAITRKALSLAFIANAQSDLDTLVQLADHFDADVETVENALAAWEKSLNRPKKSKPSAEIIANRENTELLVAELNARDGEFTAAEVADMTTDKDGNTMSPRKVGSLLSRAAKAELIAKSPEPWSVAHYARNGYEFAKKPERKRKAKAENTEDTDE